MTKDFISLFCELHITNQILEKPCHCCSLDTAVMMDNVRPKGTVLRQNSFRIERISATETRLVRVEEETEEEKEEPVDIVKLIHRTPEYIYLQQDIGKQKKEEEFAEEMKEKMRRLQQKQEKERKDQLKLILYRKARGLDRKCLLNIDMNNNGLERGENMSRRKTSTFAQRPYSSIESRKSKKACQDIPGTNVLDQDQYLARSTSAPLFRGPAEDAEGDKGRPRCSFHYHDQGLGRVYLQMPDIIHPEVSRTLSMTYSSSSLSENTRTLTGDIVKLSMKREVARHHVVKKIENRLNAMKKKQAKYLKSVSEFKRKKKDEEEELIVSTTQQLERMADDAMMTHSEVKSNRKERIKMRTMLLPENFRTANYLGQSAGKYMMKLLDCTYIRSNPGPQEHEEILKTKYKQAKAKCR